ncbi:LytTR family DNA-binding domain-containing protein [uncultured Dokdonia sp.]|uniref:LytR/AlgR family response regulator transcription factor n=1 Tax=uncultured Dokdonia sp. TaxID=575653 RepID=UPI00261B4DCF|nr:LytTR family DNA-binding domain-containing protein [uncultured Dokdonia sp.]
MTTSPISIKKANRFLPHILFVGIGIGTANYIMNGNLNWIQWSIQSIVTSFLIGYILIVIGLNKTWFTSHFTSKIKLYLFLFSVFFLIGALATEVEHYIRSLIFQSQDFQPFSSGKMYVFNGIIALILGFSFFLNYMPKNSTSNESHEYLKRQENEPQKPLDTKETITNIPVKQGETILLIPITDIVYFEAYDNYAFAYMVSGEKRLCDYSLAFLEKRLDENFSRVHRKYIVHESHIKKIKPHLNSRYIIEFDTGIDAITSSKSYTTTIRRLIKIE